MKKMSLIAISVVAILFLAGCNPCVECVPVAPPCDDGTSGTIFTPDCSESCGCADSISVSIGLHQVPVNDEGDSDCDNGDPEDPTIVCGECVDYTAILFEDTCAVDPVSEECTGFCSYRREDA